MKSSLSFEDRCLGNFGDLTPEEEADIDFFCARIREHQRSILDGPFYVPNLKGLQDATGALLVMDHGMFRPGIVTMVGGDRAAAELYRPIGVHIRHFATPREHLDDFAARLADARKRLGR